MNLYNNELKKIFSIHQPRDGSEAKNVLEEVENRKKIAKEKGLDRLITDIYFECLDIFFRWSCDSIEDFYKESYPNVVFLLKKVE